MHFCPLWYCRISGDDAEPGLLARYQDNQLSIGWHRVFEAIREPYSGPGSPYWSSKAFAGLVLPPGHPVWTAVEEPLPLELGDTAVTLRAPRWTVSGTR